MKKTILDEAAEITAGARNADYGDPRVNHKCTADLCASYLERRWNAIGSTELDAEDVCILNILQKISRHAHCRKRDNLVDIAGWARNAEVVGGY